MLTRKAATGICECQGSIRFRAVIPIAVLTTNMDVLHRMLYERNWRTRLTAVSVATEITERWISCNVYCISVDGIVSRIQKLVKGFSKH